MKILFFARLREQLNCDETTLQDQEAASVATLEDVLTVLRERGEPWASALEPDKTLAAVNQEMASLDAEVAPNDEIAFFPPVTGG